MDTQKSPPDDERPASSPPESSAPEAESPAPTPAEDEAPSTEFAEALARHEQSASGADQAAAAAKALRVGQKVHAKVLSIGDPNVIFDVGGRGEAVAEVRHWKDDAGALKIAVGDTVDLFVVDAGDPVTLAPSIKTKGSAALQKLREAKDSGTPVSGRVTGVNAGGLSVDLGGVRGFCPMSQIELGFCSDPKVYVGKTLDFLVTEVKDGRGGAVVSRRQLLRRSEAEKGKVLLEKLKVGDEIEGRVERLEAFGAFVDLGGVDGLVHVSEIAHERIGHPSQALKPGDTVRVRVLKLEPGKEGKTRIALSIKAATPDPWVGIEDRFHAGQRVTGTVARLTDFGAFVSLAPGIDGLVHVSEAAPHRIGHVREVLSPGQQVETVVRSVEPEKRRISLSIREAMGAGSAAARRAPSVGETADGVVAGIKPFGVFVDLPAYGPRVTGMIPHEESGQPRGADLAQVFTMGQKVRVEILEPRQGKVRLRLEGATPRVEERSAAGGAEAGGAPREPRTAPGGLHARVAGELPLPDEGLGARRERGRGERGGRREGGRGGAPGGEGRGGEGRRSRRRDESGRGRERDRTREWDEGGDRGGESRRSRDAKVIVVSTRPEGEELTPMALALRKAMEKKRLKDEGH